MKQTSEYPLIQWREIEDPRPQSRTKGGRKFSKAKVRAIAREEAETNYNCPKAKCKGCDTTFAIWYMKFMRDTEHPFDPPTYVCNDCGNKKQTRFAKA